MPAIVKVYLYVVFSRRCSEIIEETVLQAQVISTQDEGSHIPFQELETGFYLEEDL